MPNLLHTTCKPRKPFPPTAQPATQAGLKPGLRERESLQGPLLADSWDPGKQLLEALAWGGCVLDGLPSGG